MRLNTLFILLFLLSSCRSQQKLVESTGSAIDSCISKQKLLMQSVMNMDINDSMTSNLIKKHIRFSEGTGEIQIHPDGEVTIKGLKSADITRQDLCEKSAVRTYISDSLSSETDTEFVQTISVAAKEKTVDRLSPYSRLKTILLFALTIIILISVIDFKKLWQILKK